MNINVSDSWQGDVADMSADKLTTCCDIGDGDKTCLQKWGLAGTTQHGTDIPTKLVCVTFFFSFQKLLLFAKQEGFYLGKEINREQLVRNSRTIFMAS